MRCHTLKIRAWVRLFTSAVPVASVIALGACSHQAAAPGAAEPVASAGQAAAPGPAFRPAPLAASVFVVHTVSDLDAFEKFFDSGAALREAGSVSGYLLSKLDDGRIVIHFFADDLLHVQAALNSEEMLGFLSRAGAPDASLVWVTRDISLSLPVTPPTGQTFSLYYKLHVADINAFKSAFEARDPLYAAHGVIGRGLHQTSAEHVVVLHFVSTGRDQLQGLTRKPEFAELLALAAPEGAGKPLLAVDLTRSRPK